MYVDTKLRKELEPLLEAHKSFHYRRGDLIQQPGEPLDSSLYIKSGFIRMYAVCKNGQEVTVKILRPSTLLPVAFLPEGAKARYYFEAMSSVELWRLSRKEVLGFLDGKRDLFEQFVGSLMREGREYLSRIANLASGDAYSKVISTLIYIAESLELKKKTEITLGFPLAHRVLATMTGLTRETVTLQMLKLKKKGLIAGKGRQLMVVDLKKLQEENSSLEEPSDL